MEEIVEILDKHRVYHTADPFTRKQALRELAKEILMISCMDCDMHNHKNCKIPRVVNKKIVCCCGLEVGKS